MLTPAFDLSQDPDYLTIVIKVPYARVSEFDVYFEGDEFKFYAKPYFLRLTLPGRIVEDGREKGSYNVDEGTFTLKLPKETPSQHFEGLDMLTALLATKGSRSAKSLVEELDTPAEEDEEEEEEEDDFDWQVEQTPYVEESVTLNSQCNYGFGNLRSGVFSRLQDELSDVIDLKNPDVTPADERLPAQLAAEDPKFDPDHYLADLFEDEAILSMLKYRVWWADDMTKNSTSVGGCSLEQDRQEVLLVSFSEDEKKQLRDFKNKSFLLDKQARRQAYLSLVDILLAYCYDVRVAEGENNVESAWNIRKLSGTLSWLQSYSSVHGVMVSFGRRLLCYPLYRHFKLVMKAVKDCSFLLQTGKATVLKCLLHIHRIFQQNDPAYILNDLYITDYCIWVQKVRSKKLTALAHCLQTTSLTKAELGFELEELELAARLVQEEEGEDVTSLADSHPPSASSQVGTSDTEDSSSSSEDSESDSSSSSSSETDDTDSDSSSDSEEAKSGEEKISASKDLKICCKKGLKNKRTAPLVEELEPRQPTEAATELACIGKAEYSSQSDHGQENLVEELGEYLRTKVVLSEASEDLATEVIEVLIDNSMQCAQGLKGIDNGQQNTSLKSTSVSVDLVEKLQKELATKDIPTQHCGVLVTEACRSLQDINTHCAPTPAQKPHVGKSEQSLLSAPVFGGQVEDLGEQLDTKVVLSG